MKFSTVSIYLHSVLFFSLSMRLIAQEPPSVPPLKEKDSVERIERLAPVQITFDFDDVNTPSSTLLFLVATKKNGRYVYLRDKGTENYVLKDQVLKHIKSVDESLGNKIQFSHISATVLLGLTILSTLTYILTFDAFQSNYNSETQKTLQSIHEITLYTSFSALILYSFTLLKAEELQEEGIASYNTSLLK